jgi:glycosyltransferase involved in cell wall biosynthesis
MNSSASSELTVLHLAQSDSEGGAAKAAYRLHEALLAAGVASIFHPGRDLRGTAGTVAARCAGVGIEVTRWVAFANALALRAYPRRKWGELFSPSILSYGRPDPALVGGADVVCLHWIAGAFLRPAQLASIGKPLVWRLSDLWPFTGGCHYPGACRGFEAACGSCPTLGSARPRDLSRLGMRQRERAYRDLDLTVVAPSRWIEQEARKSVLLSERRIVHIPTGIELDVFRPRDRDAARARFGLPQDAEVILFGSLGALSDLRKGFADGLRALEAWSPGRKAPRTVLVVFGGGGVAPAEVANLSVYDVGRIDDREALADLYTAADVLLAPFAEDNLPNVVLEAIACGTPVAAYDAGGIPDAVVDGTSGALAPSGDPRALAAAIARALAGRASLARGARAHAERWFDLRSCAQAYKALFDGLSAGAQLAGPMRSNSA